MPKNKSKKIFSLIASLLVLIFVFNSNLFFVSAAQTPAEKYGLDTANAIPQLPTANGKIDIAEQIGIAIGIVLGFLGAIFLVLIIYAGLLWMTARGNEQQVTKAKGIMRDAIIGLIIVLAAYAITAFINTVIQSV